MTNEERSYPRETVEYIPFTVTVNGTQVSTGVEVAVVPDQSRPTTWSAPTVVDGKLYILISGLTYGAYHLWARVSDTPELVVIDLGTFYIT